jgi:predicted RNase H-like HicB family nuclease
MAYYVGILDGAKKVWGVRIPDAPGCHGGGASPDDAIADAISALRDYADHLKAKGIALKPPRPVEAVIRDKASEFDAKAGEAIVLVPLILDQARPVKANISLDAGTLEAIDDEAKRRGLTRSAFMASAALDHVGKMEAMLAMEEDDSPLLREMKAHAQRVHAESLAAWQAWAERLTLDARAEAMREVEEGAREHLGRAAPASGEKRRPGQRKS